MWGTEGRMGWTMAVLVSASPTSAHCRAQWLHFQLLVYAFFYLRACLAPMLGQNNQGVTRGITQKHSTLAAVISQAGLTPVTLSASCVNNVPCLGCLPFSVFSIPLAGISCTTKSFLLGLVLLKIYSR